MINKVNFPDPYGLLREDMHSLGILDPNIDGDLRILEKNDENKTVLIEKFYPNLSKNLAASGYCFVQCLYSVCEAEDIKKFRKNLENVVKFRAKGNYLEVDAILLARGFRKRVINFVAKYNEIQRRKPIRLFLFG